MNRTFLSGLTATLLITTLGTLPSYAKPSDAQDQSSEATLEAALNQTSYPAPAASIADQRPPASAPEEPVKAGSQGSNPQPETTAPANPAPISTPEALKVGERQSPTQGAPVSAPEALKVGERQSPTTRRVEAAETIAKIHAHPLAGRNAATLYVRNIPVLTFIGAASSPTASIKLGSQAVQPNDSSVSAAKSLTETNQHVSESAATPSDDPVQRASEIAAKLNQLNRDGIDASKIGVSQIPATTAPDSPEQYSIKLAETVIATVDANTLLPDTTQSLEDDALQATNRLRRLLGNATPLTEIAGKTPRRRELPLGAVRFQVSGMASWYGPGFHGNQSASGEIFDENALTAAHPTLPFGTRIRVTNLDTGLVVIVRVNDRGPYAGDRIIDLSAGAARVVGLMQSGVAPVRLDILDDSGAVVAGRGQ